MARLVTEVMSPAVPVVVVIFIVAVHSAGAGRGLLLGLVAAFFSAGFPYGVVLIGVRRGRLTDHHISRREQRPRMMAIALASLAAGLLLLFWLDAPRALFALVASMVAGLAVTLAVTSFWKISIHAAVAAVERFLARSATYTQREIAEASGFELEHLAEFRQALGLAVPDPDARVYTDEDLETAKDAAALAEMGFLLLVV